MPQRGGIRLLLFMILSAGSILADDLAWNSVNGTNWGGFYTSPYYANDKSLPPLPVGQLLTLFCLDYNHEIAPPTAWQANLTTLDPSNVTDYQFGATYPVGLLAPSAPTPPYTMLAFNGDNLNTFTNVYQRYVAAAWLFSNLLLAPDANQKNINQVAAWELFVDSNHSTDLHNRITATGGASFVFTDYLGASGSFSSLTFRTAVDDAVKAAVAAVVGGWAPTIEWHVVTGDATWVTAHNIVGGKPVAVQEFLTPSIIPPVPEPSAIVLLGTAIVAIGFAKRRKLLPVFRR